MPQAEQILNQRYQLIHLLGENASQQTWLATDLTSEAPTTVVMKLLAMSPQMQWEEAHLLEREAQILQKLNHPRIPSYRDYFMLDQLSDSRFPWFCLVQSHVPGYSLQQLLDQGRHFTEAEVERIAIEVLSILVYLHEFEPPLLHRDIKPSNLMWGENDHLYLIDFGSVQERAALEGSTFTVVGTYGYVPMEQFGGQAAPASDLYALGATLIHLLTGTAPADLPHQNARIQFAQQVSIDPAFVNWVGKLTEPDLADRLSTACLALDALKHRHHLSLPMVTRKPKGSQIQLKKTINQLEIKIPPRGWQAISWLYCLGMLGGFWYLLFQLPTLVLNPSQGWFYLLILALVLTSILLPAFSETVIRGDHTHFTFCWKLFSVMVWKKRGKTAKIHPVIGIYEQEQPGMSLVIQAGKTFLLTNAMAEVERHWLIQEIQDWLNPCQSQDLLAENTTVMPFQGGRIEVKESTDELVIQYPGTEKYSTLATVPLILLWLFLTWLTFPFLIFFAPVISGAITFIAAVMGARLYATRFLTTLRFSRDRFVLYKCLLGYTVKLSSGLNVQIDEITQDVPERLKAQGIFIQQIVIRTSDQDHAFGLGLTKPERYWVMQSINHWLQQTRHETQQSVRLHE